ncbi:MAG: SprB repeat-containing protein [Bacteroidetes bacterium]|nr:SprB repeat-containing protein [Bacteroidota bacterium]
MKKFLFAIITCLTLVNAKADDVTALVTPATAGFTNGGITLTIAGGFAPYTFSWTGPDGFTSTLQDLTALAPGEYCVNVTDNYCGTTTVCVTVTEYQPNAITNLQPVEIHVTPNPFNAYLTIDIHTLSGFDAVVKIVDLEGKEVVNQSTKLISGINKVVIEELNNLPAGNYSIFILNQAQISGSSIITKM